MKGHFHGGAEFYIVTATGVMVIFQLTRWIAGRLASNDNWAVSNAGKAIGGLYSFPAQ